MHFLAALLRLAHCSIELHRAIHTFYMYIVLYIENIDTQHRMQRVAVNKRFSTISGTSDGYKVDILLISLTAFLPGCVVVLGGMLSSGLSVSVCVYVCLHYVHVLRITYVHFN